MTPVQDHAGLRSDHSSPLMAPKPLDLRKRAVGRATDPVAHDRPTRQDAAAEATAPTHAVSWHSMITVNDSSWCRRTSVSVS